MAGSTVVSLGAGTVILLILWTVTGFLWFFFHRSQSAIRYVVVLISSVTTLTLFLLPPETGKGHQMEQYYSDEEEIIYDYMFIWKAVLILILAISLIGGVVLSISEYWTMKVHGSKAVPRRNAKIASGLSLD